MQEPIRRSGQHEEIAKQPVGEVVDLDFTKVEGDAAQELLAQKLSLIRSAIEQRLLTPVDCYHQLIKVIQEAGIIYYTNRPDKKDRYQASQVVDLLSKFWNHQDGPSFVPERDEVRFTGAHGLREIVKLLFKYEREYRSVYKSISEAVSLDEIIDLLRQLQKYPVLKNIPRRDEFGRDMSPDTYPGWMKEVDRQVMMIAHIKWMISLRNYGVTGIWEEVQLPLSLLPPDGVLRERVTELVRVAIKKSINDSERGKIIEVPGGKGYIKER